MDLLNLLQNFGLNDKQSGLYLALLQLGRADIQTIVDSTNFKRTTAYSVLEVLIEKSLVYINESDKKIYYAENPRKLTNLLAEENKRLLARQKSLIEAIPELTVFYNAKSSKPKTHLFEGKEGIKEIYEEMLDQKSGSEILTFESPDLAKGALLDIWSQNHTKRRLAKKISQRVLANNSDFNKEQQKNDEKEMRITCLLSKDKFPFKNEINIYKNKIAIISFKELIGITIESADIFTTQRSIFELAWLGAEQMIAHE